MYTMDENHADYLTGTFPFYPPGFFFECGDGWFKIVKELSEKIDALNAPDLVVHQVKEKFGGLRFYFHTSDAAKYDEIEQLVSRAEAESIKTCENCGKSGEERKRDPFSPIVTLCSDCWQKFTTP